MSPNTTRLAGRTALVTGSTGGLGAAFATALAQQGALSVDGGWSAV
jgi:NAD(P)-dependent dehydrogenase (short-subunit alcohol dehydrogenase family)